MIVDDNVVVPYSIADTAINRYIIPTSKGIFNICVFEAVLVRLVSGFIVLFFIIAMLNRLTVL